MIKTVHVVPHTHWDREWFFTTSRAQTYLLKDIKDVIDNLENNVGFNHFILDGQASLIADYLKWRPQDLKKVQRLVKEKKLIIGPWYTQTDQYLPSGENITRNLLYGMRICSDLGGYMNIGYVPDSFGQESSMPQIYKSLGINAAMLWRVFPDYDAKHSEFIWQGEDGTRINVYRMACGYFIGGLIDETKLNKIMKEEPFTSVIKQATTNQILFPQGSDMAPARNDLPKVIKKLNQVNKDLKFRISSIEEYINAVNTEKPKLELLKGEYNIGKNMRVHKSNYSSRSDLKKMNTLLQDYLTNILEPVLTLGDRFNVEYPKEEVNDIWEKMFENSAHDSMANSVSDNVNEDIYFRYKQVKDMATSLVELTLRQISTRIKSPEDKPITVTVYNTLPTIRNGVITKKIYSPTKEFTLKDTEGNQIPFVIQKLEDESEEIKGATIQLDPGQRIYKPEKVYGITISFAVDKIPAMGYAQFYLIPNAKSTEYLLNTNDDYISNSNFEIKVNLDGSLKITDKRNGIIYNHQAILEENGDDGDSYNYSPAKKDWIIYSTNQEHSVQIKKSSLLERIEINYTFRVPRTLNDRARKKLNCTLPIKLIISLFKNSQTIKFKVKIDNSEPLDHRLCIDFATNILAKFSTDDIQFGVINRPFVLNKAMKSWKKHPDQWQEKPISINTMQTFTSLSDNHRTFAVIPNGVREYEDIGKDHSTIRLTLLRTYGKLGKKDLLYRPGRASGDATVATPDAELQKKLIFDFGIYISDKTFDNANVAQIAKKYKTPLIAFEYAEFLNGRLIFPFNIVKRNLSEQGSLFETKGHLILSTVKKAEQRPGYIVRFYNGGFKTINDEIHFNKEPVKVELVNLKEDFIKKLDVSNSTAKIKAISHAKVISIYFEF